MPASQLPATAPVSADVVELERALTRVAYLITRNRRHDLLTAAAGVPLDRAAVMVLQQLAESGAMRPSELAEQLQVEAPHITRQVQRLQQAGYLDRAPDPDDRRAHLIQLTPSGRAAADRLREVRQRGMEAALARWSP
jgi:DNA-binding MarR family transcriptional regulator